MIALVPVVLSYVDTSIYKPQLEKAASEALGLDVRVGSRLTVAFTPGFNVSFDNVKILSRGPNLFLRGRQVSNWRFCRCSTKKSASRASC